MKTFAFILMLAAVATLGLLSLTGCNQQCAVPEKNNAPQNDLAASATAIPAELVKYKDTIQKLPEAEWAAVYKQGTCPVSGEPLGSMGTPIKVTVEGRDVYLCCEGCRKALEDDPEKYLGKLPK